MDYETAKRLADEINRQPTMKQLLKRSKNDNENSNQYSCIFCGSGTHAKGTGAMTDYGDHVYCHVCKQTGHNTDIIAAYLGCSTSGKDFFRVVEFGCRKCCIAYSEVTKPESNPDFSTSVIKKFTIEKNKIAPPRSKSTKNYLAFYSYAQSRLADFIERQGGAWRGLSLEDLQSIRAGYNEREFKGEKIRCVILPHNDFSYFERSITDTPFKIKQHHGTPKVIFNPYNVLNCGKVIFIVEGEIDAITIHKFGYPVIALGGAAEINLLMKTLKEEVTDVENKPVFVVMFDNNDDGIGQRSAKELVLKLREEGYGAVNYILSPNLRYDANEFFQINSVSLSARLSEIYNLAEKELSALAEEMKLEIEKKSNKIFGTKFDFFFQHKYLETTIKNRRFENLQTGFPNFDEMQEFEAGIYTIGAPPSIGKTSFLWQLLEQMARKSNEHTKIHCVFCSYEMSEDVLFSKSFARGVFKNGRADNELFEPNENLTSARIRKGIAFVKGYVEDCLKVFEDLKNDNIDLRVLDLTTTPLEIDDLIKRLEKIATVLPSEDILIFGIDYLQRIPNSQQETVKQAVDYAMLELKKFTQRTNSIIFLISSYNRVSYRTETGFEAFKESGAIEYSSDVMFALQLYCLDEKGKPSTAQADFDLAKRKQPRSMILKCLKNRFGNDYRIYFQYYSAVDTFIPCDESDLNML